MYLKILEPLGKYVVGHTDVHSLVHTRRVYRWMVHPARQPPSVFIFSKHNPFEQQQSKYNTLRRNSASHCGENRRTPINRQVQACGVLYILSPQTEERLLTLPEIMLTRNATCFVNEGPVRVFQVSHFRQRTLALLCLCVQEGAGHWN